MTREGGGGWQPPLPSEFSRDFDDLLGLLIYFVFKLEGGWHLLGNSVTDPQGHLIKLPRLFNQARPAPRPPGRPPPFRFREYNSHLIMKTKPASLKMSNKA